MLRFGVSAADGVAAAMGRFSADVSQFPNGGAQVPAAAVAVVAVRVPIVEANNVQKQKQKMPMSMNIVGRKSLVMT